LSVWRRFGGSWEGHLGFGETIPRIFESFGIQGMSVLSMSWRINDSLEFKKLEQSFRLGAESFRASKRASKLQENFRVGEENFKESFKESFRRIKSF
jgi:hypothetical protein